MGRAFLIEMTVLKNYVRQLFGMGLFVALCISLGMQSFVATGGMLTMLLFLMGSMSCAAYDEQNNWGMFRLTMPLSRRDVVLGRYAAILAMGCMGMLIGVIVMLAIALVAPMLPLSADFLAGFELTSENLLGATFSIFVCFLGGSFVASVVTPLYFRFGQTRATQYLPLISVLLFIIPIVALSGLDVDGMAHIASLLSFIESPTGVAASSGVMVAAALALMAVSSLASLKLYEHREL